MKVKEKKWIRFRIYVVAGFFLLGLVTILARAYQLQILQKDRLVAMARAGYIGSIKMLPKRGAIYDRKGHVLALSVEVESIYAHPNRITEKHKTARQLSHVLGERRGKILKLLKGQRPFVWVKRRIDPDRAERVRGLKLKGIGLTTETKRCYPGREIGSHLIGFVGSDNKGLEGLEKRYDSFLSGPERTITLMRNAFGRPFLINGPIVSRHGIYDLILTIDKDIQYQAQQALEAAVEKARAKAGHCVVVDPETGEILAMAVVPEYNPNVFSKYRPYQWRNRVITDCYEPGSTMKAFLLAACLEEGVVSPDTLFDCEQGEYSLGEHVIHDTHKYGVLSVSGIIKHSSNIGAIKLGQKVGYAKFYDYMKKFGFGAKTGLGLQGERMGSIRSPRKISPIDEATIFFGQGVSTTSIQLVMAMAAIANGGKLMRPYVVKAIVDESGDRVMNNHPKVIRRVLSPRTASRVSRILEGVVSEEGTGLRAAIRGFRAAGKTGTAQKVDPETRKYSMKRFVATFVGFVPVDKPRLVILVVVDEPKGMPYGGVVAAPVFREVGLWSLNYLRINPQIGAVVVANGGAEQDPAQSRASLISYAERERFNGGKINSPPEIREKVKTIGEDILGRSKSLPDFRGLGMRDVLKEARSLGLKVGLEGTGLAYRQHPRAGSSLTKVSMVKVSFRPPT